MNLRFLMKHGATPRHMPLATPSGETDAYTSGGIARFICRQFDSLLHARNRALRLLRLIQVQRRQRVTLLHEVADAHVHHQADRRIDDVGLLFAARAEILRAVADSRRIHTAT